MDQPHTNRSINPPRPAHAHRMHMQALRSSVYDKLNDTSGISGIFPARFGQKASMRVIHMGWHTLLSQRVSPDQLVRMLAQLRERALDRPGESRCVLGRLTTVRGSKGVWVRRVELLGPVSQGWQSAVGTSMVRHGEGVARAWQGRGRGLAGVAMYRSRLYPSNPSSRTASPPQLARRTAVAPGPG